MERKGGMMRVSMTVWRAPLFLSVVTFSGLVLALVLEGPVADLAAVIGLGLPCGVMAWRLCRPLH